jgi:Uncharacterized protein conserved in bacteria (DUF2330)
MRAISYSFAAILTLLAVFWASERASACGGFFCNSSPVDQSAERIIFVVNDDGTTDMIVQIAYSGDSKDFAWLLPLANVPDAQRLDTFPEQAMTSLDAQTGPQFTLPPNCTRAFAGVGGGGFAGGLGGGVPTAVGASGGVSVFIQQTVGPYEVAVIGSEDAEATSEWLLDNGYRITGAMNDFVKLYTEEKMKFLALKLTDTADVTEIAPFRLRLPGDSPSIPLRLTSIAALPEMGIVVWVFGKERFEPAGDAQEVEIAKQDLRWDPNRFFNFGGATGPSGTNWYTLVARAADKAQGKAWVVDQAGPTSTLAASINQQMLVPGNPNFEAQQALSQLVAGRPYMTRLYTRLSPEEMTYDPVFKRSTKGDVARVRELPFVAELCDTNAANDNVKPCDFNPCGALALCRDVTDDMGTRVAACACAPGLTARAVPAGALAASTTVSCIDERLSFLNVGDRGPEGDVLPDPCVGVDCGENGVCVNMNMTATCECKAGFVARPRLSFETKLTCVKPTVAIPSSFYGMRMPDRALPTGREVRIVEVMTPPDRMLPSGGTEVHVVEVDMPPSAAAPGSSKSSSCAVTSGRGAGPGGALALAGMALVLGVYVRRRKRTAPAARA